MPGLTICYPTWMNLEPLSFVTYVHWDIIWTHLFVRETASAADDDYSDYLQFKFYSQILPVSSQD